MYNKTKKKRVNMYDYVKDFVLPPDVLVLLIQELPSPARRHTKRPVLEHQDLDDIQRNARYKRDPKHGHRLAHRHLGCQPSKNNHQQRNHLGSNNNDRKHERRHGLPKESLQPRREDEEVGRGRNVEIHDRVQFAVDDSHVAVGFWVGEVSFDFPEVEEMAEGEACQKDTQQAREEDQLAHSPLVWLRRDLITVNENKQGLVSMQGQTRIYRKCEL